MQASSITKYLLSRWPRSLEDYYTFRADKSRPLKGFTIVTDPQLESNTTYIHGRWYFEPNALSLRHRRNCLFQFLRG